MRPSKLVKTSLQTLPIWFEETKKGEVTVAKALPDLSVALGLPRYLNNQIRPTTVETLKRAGFEDREIQDITGHKILATLNNYNPVPTTSRKAQMARALTNPEESLEAIQGPKLKVARVESPIHENEENINVQDGPWGFGT